VEEARVPGQPPTIGKQQVNFIIRVYGMKYKIFHERVLIKIKSSRNETLVLSIWIRILVPNFPNTTAWDHTSDPSSKSAMCPNGILAVGCIPIGSVVIFVMGHYYKFLSKHSSNPQHCLIKDNPIKVL
jgi:hypothetical protein